MGVSYGRCYVIICLYTPDVKELSSGEGIGFLCLPESENKKNLRVAAVQMHF